LRVPRPSALAPDPYAAQRPSPSQLGKEKEDAEAKAKAEAEAKTKAEAAKAVSPDELSRMARESEAACANRSAFHARVPAGSGARACDPRCSPRPVLCCPAPNRRRCDAPTCAEEIAPDDAEVRDALSDPAVVRALQDPMVQRCLQVCRAEPHRLPEFLREPRVRFNLEVLRRAGVIGMA